MCNQIHKAYDKNQVSLFYFFFFYVEKKVSMLNQPEEVIHYSY